MPELFPPRRQLGDWHPDCPNDEQTWLARWAARGWQVEHGPADLFIHGQWVHRYAFIHVGAGAGEPGAAQGQAVVEEQA